MFVKRGISEKGWSWQQEYPAIKKTQFREVLLIIHMQKIHLNRKSSAPIQSADLNMSSIPG
jgi:hypothetical protein